MSYAITVLKNIYSSVDLFSGCDHLSQVWNVMPILHCHSHGIWNCATIMLSLNTNENTRTRTPHTSRRKWHALSRLRSQKVYYSQAGDSAHRTLPDASIQQDRAKHGLRGGWKYNQLPQSLRIWTYRLQVCVSCVIAPQKIREGKGWG